MTLPTFPKLMSQGFVLTFMNVFSAIHYKDVFQQNGMESSKNSRGNLDVSFVADFFDPEFFHG